MTCSVLVDAGVAAAMAVGFSAEACDGGAGERRAVRSAVGPPFSNGERVQAGICGAEDRQAKQEVNRREVREAVSSLLARDSR
jgi:hypothetical protein